MFWVEEKIDEDILTGNGENTGGTRLPILNQWRKSSREDVKNFVETWESQTLLRTDCRP